ncbi:MAG: hypothetical protein AAF497_04750 [Planctomycetota bacterium]
MTGKCIQDLAAAIDGSKLRFGTMPPLGGELEPIGRIIPVGTAPRPRDVVVFTAEDEAQDAVSPSELYFQGALGVVTSRPVTALPGAFSLQVPCATAGPCQLVDWYRAASSTVVVAVVGDTSLTRRLPPHWNDTFGHVELADPALPLAFRGLLAMDSEEIALVDITSNEIVDKNDLVQSLRPEVIVLAQDVEPGLLNAILASASRTASIISTSSEGRQNELVEQAASHHRMQWCHVGTNDAALAKVAENSGNKTQGMDCQELLAIGIASNIRIAVLESLRKRRQQRIAS